MTGAVPDHTIEGVGMVDHIVELVERRAAALQAQGADTEPAKVAAE